MAASLAGCRKVSCQLSSTQAPPPAFAAIADQHDRDTGNQAPNRVEECKRMSWF